MGKRTPTSINVDEELWKEARMEALRRGMTVTDLFEQSLRKELGKESTNKLQGGKLKGGKL
jgi:hypothetical protein